MYPVGVCLVPNAYLLHHDADIYPDPYEFRPERFLDEPPGTYTWIPFGGGRRRCVGASFALLEMRIVLRSVLSACELQAGAGGAEPTRRRNITIRPAAGARVRLRGRRPAAVAA
jgi:cytochrome P450 family 135